MKQQTFYFDRLRPWDYITVLFYSILTLTIYLQYKGIIELGYTPNYLLCYTLGTHLFLYFFNYRSLRNLAVFLVWMCIGLFHLIIYLQLRDDPNLQLANGHAASGLRNTIILLFLFQLLRILSLNIQKKEFVAVSKSSTDLFDERRINILDTLIFVIYFISAVGLLFWE